MSEDTMMPGARLGIHLPASPDAIEAHSTLTGLQELLALFTRPTGEPIGWRFASLELGSLTTSVMSDGVTQEWVDDRIADLRSASTGEIDASRWTEADLDHATKACRMLGRNGGAWIFAPGASEVRLDDQVADHLYKARRSTRTSIGSVTGRIESLLEHRSMHATLWLDRSGRSVKLVYDQRTQAEVRSSFGKRVRAHGILARDLWGAPAELRLSTLTVLAGERDMGMRAAADRLADSLARQLDDDEAQ